MLFAMFTLVVLTMVIGFITLTCRVKSVKSGDLSIKYYQLMQGDNVPELITKTSRCFSNMFEIPVLFYVVCSLFLSLHIESVLAVILAWFFVFFRCLQAFIHLTYNNVLHRMAAFWGGVICMFLLWLNLVFSQL